MTWQKAQEWEQSWWGSCHNTYGEEYKQLLYADRMGLKFFHDGKGPFNIDLQGRSVLDIGSGPASLLLKCVSGDRVAIDPLNFPSWVLDRYSMAGVQFEQEKGEDYNPSARFDECWIYNVLQHTNDPALVIANAKRLSNLIRLFEWIDTPTNEGHPHSLSAERLDQWLGGEGKTENLNGQNTCTGRCYYGIFPT